MKNQNSTHDKITIEIKTALKTLNYTIDGQSLKKGRVVILLDIHENIVTIC